MLRRIALGIAVLLLWLAPKAAHANGRLPGAVGLAINPVDERQLLVGLTFGLALTRDGGASWSWICEQQIGGDAQSDINPSMIVTEDGTLVALSLTHGGVLVSRDNGCSFEDTSGPLQHKRGVDLTSDPSQPGHILALMSTIGQVSEAGYPSFNTFLGHSLDNGQSWEILHQFPDDLVGETVEIAASDANRIYVSGTLTSNALKGIVERSDDGGITWKRTIVELPHGSGSLFISAVHPSDPDRLWARVPGRGDIFGVDPTKLWLSVDGAQSFAPLAETKAGMLGFALSPDGTRIAFGGPQDGLLVAPADESAAATKVASMHVNCLRWMKGGLYVCGSEPSDPYSLGFAADPMDDFVPRWQRSEMCLGACSQASTLEMNCSASRGMIAPLVGAQDAMCDAADAGSSGVASSVGSAGNAGHHAGSAGKPSQPMAAMRSAGGCALLPGAAGAQTLWLAVLAFSYLLVRRLLNRRRMNRAGLIPSAAAVSLSSEPGGAHQRTS